jgi:hypothetical protein
MTAANTPQPPAGRHLFTQRLFVTRMLCAFL